MDAAAPEAVEATTSAEAATQARNRAWRRVKIPTSVVVTLVGIALTAWLLPAFTRQWDDRQKARELKATLSADMASATTRALIAGEAIWAQPGRKIDRAQVADDWARSSLATEARLRAYFSQRIVTAWQIYTWMIDRFVGGHRLAAQAALSSAGETLSEGHYATLGDTSPAPQSDTKTTSDNEVAAEGQGGGWAPQPARLDPNAAFAAASVLNFVGSGPGGPSYRLEGYVEQDARFALWNEVRPNLESDKGGDDPFELGTGQGYPYSDVGAGQLDHLMQALVEFEEELIREVLAANPSGFSATTRDLVNDLLPF